jgi:hypothetical protein
LLENVVRDLAGSSLKTPRRRQDGFDRVIADHAFSVSLAEIVGTASNPLTEKWIPIRQLGLGREQHPKRRSPVVK